MYKSVDDFFVAENTGLFLGRRSYAHPARFITLKRTASSDLQNLTIKNRQKTPYRDSKL